MHKEMPDPFTPLDKVSVLPTAWEVQKGLLRRTPRLLQYEKEGVIQGEGWTLKADGDWYMAHELYAVLGLRDEPRPFYLFFPKGEKAWAELPPRRPSPKPSLALPATKEEKPSNAPPANPSPSANEGKPVKRVRIGRGMDEEIISPSPSPPPRGKREAVGPSEGEKPLFLGNRSPQGEGAGNKPSSSARTTPPLDETVYLWLWGLLGEEEFSPYSVDSLLAYRGYQPQAVWNYLKGKGLLKETSGGFFSLVPPSRRHQRGKVLEEVQEERREEVAQRAGWP